MKYKAFAKINLLLEIINQRSDGYHNIKSYMVPVDLFDVIEIFDLPRDIIEITCDDKNIPTDRTNLAYKAADSLKRHCKIRNGVRIDIKKRIPTGAGLGGGSSNAGMVLRLLVKKWNLKISNEKLLMIATEIGADVPFFLNPTLSEVSGIGDVVTPMDATFDCFVLIVNPGIEVSTRNVYKGTNIYLLASAARISMKNALEKKNYPLVCKYMNNHLEKFAMTAYPEIAILKNELLKFGFDGVLMSGSGSSVYAVTRDERRLNIAYDSFKQKYDKVYKTRTL